MKIALVMPNGELYRKKQGSFKKSLRYAPLTLTTLASLVPDDLEAKIELFDEGIQEIDTQRLNADLVGITSITGTANRAYEIADRLRQRGMPVVLGGVHTTLLPEEAQEHADSIVIGQGEQTWPQLVRDFNSGTMKSRYSTEDLDLTNLPKPRRDLLKKRDYLTINTVQATRGCPNSCDFCATPPSVKGYYHRPVEEVIDEIKALDPGYFLFLDPSPIEDSDYAKNLYEKLIPLRRKWAGLATTKITQDKELLDLTVKSGCRGLLIGFESLSDNNLSRIRKGFNDPKQYAESIKELHKNNIAVMGCFVFGFDQDTKDVFKRTVDFANKNKIEIPRYSVYTPYPGTPLFKRLEKEERILHKDWSLYDVQHVVFQPENMSPEELQQGLYQAWDKTYSLPSILKRNIQSGTGNKLLMLAANMGYRHYAKNLPKSRSKPMEMKK